MKKKPKILLLGNIKEDVSLSMKIYLEYLKKNLKNEVDSFEPSCGKIHIKFYKNFIYPLIIPKGYDIYHIVDHSYAHLAHFLPGGKTIVTCHDLIPLHFKQYFGFLANLSFKYYLSGLKRAKKIIADSENTKRDLITKLKIEPSKIKVIHALSVDQKLFVPLNKNKLKCKHSLGGKIVLLNIGSAFYKNTLLSLKALKKLNKKGDDFILVKIGEFTSDEKRFIQKNNLENKVIAKKKASRKELVEAYNFADIFIFPSLYEGFGIPPLEAMACNTPVISSNVSSLPEIVGDAAIQIDPFSVDQLIMAIEKLVNNRGVAKEMIRKGLLNLKRFTKEKQKEEMKKIYSGF